MESRFHQSASLWLNNAKLEHKKEQQVTDMFEWIERPFILGTEDVFYLVMMAFCVALPCSQLGSFLVLRRMSLVGDAISHSVLPGIVVAFLFTEDLSSPWLLVGASGAGLLVTFMIELIHSKTRVKQDAAIGIAFTSLFSIGVILVSVYASQVHIDADCVVYGKLVDILNDDVMMFGYEVPKPLVTSAIVAALTMLTVIVCYRILLLSSFDPGMAASIGYRPRIVHYALMAVLSMVVVTSFQAVGAILVIALLIIPAAAAYLCTHRLKVMLILSGIHALISSVMGLYLYVWIGCSFAAAMVVAGAILFMFAWLFGPADGIITKAIYRRSVSLGQDENRANEPTH
jgi:manganese/zinc/iron transport system permease protein